MAKPSTAHRHRSVGRVVLFNGVCLSRAEVTCCADSPELENRQGMAGNARARLLEECLYGGCVLPLREFFPSGGSSGLVI